MPSITEVGVIRVGLDGWDGAPGSNHWLVSKGDGATWGQAFESFAATLDSFYSSIEEYLVSGVTWNISRTCLVYEAQTGLISDDYLLQAPVKEGTGQGLQTELSRACSAHVVCIGDGRVNNRRTRSSCYIGPLASEAIGDEGLLDPTFVVLLFVPWQTDPIGPEADHAAWRRPVVEVTDAGDRIVKRDGQAFTAQSPQTRSLKVAMLTSRRD